MCQFRSWTTLGKSLAKGHKVLKCQGGGDHRGTRIRLFSSFIIQRQFAPGAGQFPLALSAPGHATEVSCPDVLFILLTKETGSLVNTGDRWVLVGGQDLRHAQVRGSARLPRRCLT